MEIPAVRRLPTADSTTAPTEFTFEYTAACRYLTCIFKSASESEPTFKKKKCNVLFPLLCRKCCASSKWEMGLPWFFATTNEKLLLNDTRIKKTKLRIEVSASNERILRRWNADSNRTQCGKQEKWGYEDQKRFRVHSFDLREILIWRWCFAVDAILKRKH